MARHQFQNKRRLYRKLARIPAVTRQQMREGLIKSAVELVADQKAYSPLLSGDLRESIQWTEDVGSLSHAERKAARKQIRAGDIAVVITAGGNEAFYAHMLEFGTVKAPAQPFFFPPYRALRKRLRRRAVRIARKAAREAVAREGSSNV